MEIAGFRELPHTADWEIEVWAVDLPGLFEQAARGMIYISGMMVEPNNTFQRIMKITADDSEGLLVRFLNELLYIQEIENQGFLGFSISILDNQLKADLTGSNIICIKKEIKAVTWHKLAIRKVENVFKVNIVFDV
jgi:SHS2 domain-containing protein